MSALLQRSLRVALVLTAAAAAALALHKYDAKQPYCRHYGGCYPRAAPRDYPYLPAPPGKTPRCARPGATFCESADHYPTHLIQYLVDRWAFDFNTLLQSEGDEDFSDRYPVTYAYGPPRPQDNATSSAHGYQPAASYGPPGYHQQQEGYPDRRYSLNAALTDITYAPTASTPVPEEALESFPADHHKQLQRGVSINPAGPIAWARFRRDATRRRRRQTSTSEAGSTTLCPTVASFIAPQAALNTKGVWMFVANVPDRGPGGPGGAGGGGGAPGQGGAQGSRYTQLVRAESCVTSECNGICSLPSGYTSRCEQQYVQKRLVALGGSGDRLYQDTFWFPHCCVCHIRASS